MRGAHLHHRDGNNCSRPQMKDFQEESIYYCHSSNPPSVSKIIGAGQTGTRKTTTSKPSHNGPQNNRLTNKTE